MGDRAEKTIGVIINANAGRVRREPGLIDEITAVVAPPLVEVAYQREEVRPAGCSAGSQRTARAARAAWRSCAFRPARTPRATA